VASARRIWKGAAVLAAVALIALVANPTALAAFGARTQDEGDIVTAAADFTPPAISAAAIGKTVGGATGFIKRAARTTSTPPSPPTPATPPAASPR
jgi:hypothetical protein